MRLSISPRVTIQRVPVFFTQTGGLHDKGNGSARRKTGWPVEGETTSDIAPSSWEGRGDKCSCQSNKLIGVIEHIIMHKFEVLSRVPSSCWFQAVE